MYIFSLWIINLLSILCFIVFIIGSFIFLMRALKGRIDIEEFEEDEIITDSLMHFQTIGNQEFKDFTQKIEDETPEKIKEDLLSQIYINSKICTKKFKLYNNGILWLTMSTVAFIVVFLSAFLLN
ncbi:Pycsar system effector family protein [Brochothrix campestris]|uniref:Pycsar system effector family protein n=1 Tax=Brochothrix campestris TaxID=2757 RepID=UPI0038D0A17B